MQKKRGPILVCIRDGWGYRKEAEENRILDADAKNTDRLMKNYPNTILKAAGSAVGLPDGYMGNSEVGHITIGSGRIINQAMVRINQSIIDKSFYSNESLLVAVNNCKTYNSTMHVIALLQYEGVHSLYSHIYSVIDLCKKQGLYKVCIHVITDGRDAPVNAGDEKIKRLENDLKDFGIGDIATISGRYYAMDRDNRWDRTKKAYEAIVNGNCDIIIPIEECYKNKETDEFIIPRKKEWYRGIKKNDSCIFVNFRTDRTRQLTSAIVEKKFEKFPRRTDMINNLCFVAMTKYYEPMNALVAFEDIKIENHLGEVLSKAGLKQLRISETEKYAHVTFFFNGENEVPYKNEDRILIESPKVATYDLKPEMSAREITSKIIEKISSEEYDIIITNIVNADMVGHTGIKTPSIKAVEVVDECVGRLADEIIKKNGTALIFADHGNIEDQTDMWRTSHTKNPVPFILVSNNNYKLKENGGLQDIAPTVLDLLGICKPKEMTGNSLIIKKEENICKMVDDSTNQQKNKELKYASGLPPAPEYDKIVKKDSFILSNNALLASGTISKENPSRSLNVKDVLNDTAKGIAIEKLKPIENKLKSSEIDKAIKSITSEYAGVQKHHVRHESHTKKQDYSNTNLEVKIPLDVPKKKKEEYLKNYMEITKGTGKIMLFAGDQKIEHLNEDYFGDGIAQEDNNPKHLFEIASKSKITVFATQLGLINRYGMDYKDVPYLVKLNSKTNIVPTSQRDPISKKLATVEHVIEVKNNSGLNILGVGYTLYLGSAYETEMLEEVSELIYEAHKNGLIFILWIYPRGKAVLDEKDPHLTAGATGTAACLGADFVKVSYPVKKGFPSEEIFKEAVEAAGRTGVVCAGGGTTDAEVFLESLYKQIHISGARGNATGRNIHQRPLHEAINLCNAIYAITIEDKTVDEAMKIYHG